MSLSKVSYCSYGDKEYGNMVTRVRNYCDKPLRAVEYGLRKKLKMAETSTSQWSHIVMEGTKFFLNDC